MIIRLILQISQLESEYRAASDWLAETGQRRIQDKLEADQRRKLSEDSGSNSKIADLRRQASKMIESQLSWTETSRMYISNRGIHLNFLLLCFQSSCAFDAIISSI